MTLSNATADASLESIDWVLLDISPVSVFMLDSVLLVVACIALVAAPEGNGSEAADTG
jgi:hypothetical protein